MPEILLHIPHSSKEIPPEYLADYLDCAELNETLLKLTDTFTDDLFSVDGVAKIIFPYSRAFCDVERFLQDEPMEKFGQGFYFTNGIYLKPFRNEINKDNVRDNFYKPHYSLIEKTLQTMDEPLLIDCHSFSNEIFPCTPFSVDVLPDFILGHNGKEKEIEICNVIDTYLVDLGFKVIINQLYNGSLSINNCDSIMIEINKRLYLSDDYLNKRNDYYKSKQLITTIIRQINEYKLSKCRSYDEFMKRKYNRLMIEQERILHDFRDEIDQIMEEEKTDIRKTKCKKTVMKNILNCLVISLLSILLLGCHDFLFQELGGKKKEKTENNSYELRPLDKLFINGFSISLEQIYIMSSDNTDNYVDYCFKNGNETANLLNYQTTDYNNTFLMYGLTQGMKWKVSKMIKEPKTTVIEHGYGTNYFTATINDTITYNYIYVKDDITLLTQYIVGDIYTYRSPDDHILKIQTIDANGKASYTNLVLEVIKEFDGTYLWLQTNNQYNITYSLTAPLTGSQVANEIAKGNYTLYLWNGLTTYKIGNNLYIPRFNSYVYVGSINQNGMINGYNKLYYRLKFIII